MSEDPKMEWAEFLEARRRMIVWFRDVGVNGPEGFAQISAKLSLDPGQAELIYTATKDRDE